MHVALTLVFAALTFAGPSSAGGGGPADEPSRAQAGAAVHTDAAAPADADAHADAGAQSDADAAAENGSLPPSESAPPAALHPLRLHLRARGSRDPVVAATVLEGGAVCGESDGHGDVALSLPAGHHALQISADGFLLERVAVELPATNELTLGLTRRPGGLRYQSVVRASSAAAPARVSLTEDEASHTAGALGDPFRVVPSLPGVAQLALAIPAFTVRGSNPGNTGFFLDDVRIPALFHFALGPAVVQPGFIDHLDFYPGSYPARFGRFVGGAVVASTPAPPRDRVRGTADVRLYDASATVSSPFHDGQGTVMVGGRYSYTGGLLSIFSPDLVFDYWDYQLRAEHPGAGGKLTLLAFGSHDRLARKNKQEDDTERDLALGFHRLSLRYVRLVGPGRASASLALGRDASSLPFQAHTRLALTAWSWSPRLAYTQELASWVTAELGAEGTWQEIGATVNAENTGPAAGLSAFAQSRSLRLVGGWATLSLEPHPRVSLAPSVRWDGYQESGARAGDLAPRLDVRWQVAPTTALKLNGGRFTQLPTLPLPLPGVEGFGLATLGLQSSWQGAAGLETTAPGKLSFEGTLFVQRGRLSDIRDLRNGSSPLLDDFLTRREALSYGAELLLRRPPSEPFYGWISYTLSWSLRAYEGGVVAPSDWDQRHVLNVVAGWHTGANTLGARFHAHTGRLVAIEDLRPPELRRLPTFWELDLRAEHRFTFDTFVVDLYLEAVNATLNRDAYGLRWHDERVVTDGYRIVLPSLGARATF